MTEIYARIKSKHDDRNVWVVVELSEITPSLLRILDVMVEETIFTEWTPQLERLVVWSGLSQTGEIT